MLYLNVSPAWRRSEPLSVQPLYEWRDLHSGPRRIPVSLSSAVPRQDLWIKWVSPDVLRLSIQLSINNHDIDITVIIVLILCLVVLECRFRNGGCMQYCRDLPGGAGVLCGCTEGFILEPDGQSCASTGIISLFTPPMFLTPSVSVSVPPSLSLSPELVRLSSLVHQQPTASCTSHTSVSQDPH